VQLEELERVAARLRRPGRQHPAARAVAQRGDHRGAAQRCGGAPRVERDHAKARIERVARPVQRCEQRPRRVRVHKRGHRNLGPGQCTRGGGHGQVRRLAIALVAPPLGTRAHRAIILGGGIITQEFLETTRPGFITVIAIIIAAAAAAAAIKQRR
jgi:hypothetical protein